MSLILLTTIMVTKHDKCDKLLKLRAHLRNCFHPFKPWFMLGIVILALEHVVTDDTPTGR